MPILKTVTYTIEIDAERYARLPHMAYGGVTYPVGSFQTSAEILKGVLGHPAEIPDRIWWKFDLGNFNAIKAWLNKSELIGTFPLFSVSEPTQSPITWTIKTQIRGIP